MRARNGWITSIPGAIDVTIEALPGSTLPDELRELGYDVEAVGQGERILPMAITERLVVGAEPLESATAGSTRPIARTVTHAGIVPVNRFQFALP